MQYALQFAETGHLCVATLHANNANQALDRVLNLIPKSQREQFLYDLATNLKGILAQQLVPDKHGVGRHGVFELLVNTANVADLIRRDELHQLKGCIAKGSNAGMISFDQALFALYSSDKISLDDAMQHADSRNELRLMMTLSEGQPSNTLLNDVHIAVD